jgi:hypothetical protein
MAPNTSRFISKIDDVIDLTNEAITAILNEAAIQAESYAKQNIIAQNTIDTGFMLNSTYAILVDSEGKPAESKTMTDKHGNRATRESVSGPATDKQSSAVGCGSNYAIYMELAHPFIGPAADQVEGDIDALIAKHRLK